MALRGDQDDVRLQMPRELRERLRSAAREHDRSEAAEIRVALRLYLDHLDRRREPASSAA